MSENIFPVAQSGSTESPKKSFRIRKKFSLIFFLSLFIVFTFIFADNFSKEWEVEVTQAVIYPLSQNNLSDKNDSIKTSSEVLFQASGWIEPDPFPIRVTPLYSGVVKKVHVLEGQKVIKDQIIVSLVEEDARLALSETEAQFLQSTAEEKIIETDIELAKATLDGVLAQLAKEEVLLEDKNDSLSRLNLLPEGAVAEQIIYQAKLAVRKQEAVRNSSLSEVEQHKIKISKLEKELSAQKNTTKVFHAQMQKAELDFNRTKVRSPVDGVVLRLIARPGSRIMLHMDDMDAGSAAILYEEGKLQARIDVPLSEAAKIFPGQNVEVSSTILPEEKFNGIVTRILGEADLQRNTLQVKVSLLNPNPKLRPEMLCRAKFFGSNSENHSENQEVKVFVSEIVPMSSQNAEVELFVISKNGNQAEQRRVKFGNLIKEGFIEVLEGLLPGDKIIINPASKLRAGDRIKVVGIK